MNSKPEQPEPRKASDLDQILDDLVGFDPREPLEISEEDDGAGTPLSAGMIEQTLAEVARLQQIGSRVGAGGLRMINRPRRWWLRPAALIPFAFVLLGAVPAAYYLFWDPRDPHSLSYENAHDAAFDYKGPHNSEENRNLAVSRVMRPIVHGITAIRRAIARDATLATDGQAVLQAIEDMIVHPRLADSGTRLASGGFQKIIDTLETETSAKLLRKTFVRYLAGCKSGFQVLHRATKEPGLVGREGRKRLGTIKRMIHRKLPAQNPKRNVE